MSEPVNSEVIEKPSTVKEQQVLPQGGKEAVRDSLWSKVQRIIPSLRTKANDEGKPDDVIEEIAEAPWMSDWENLGASEGETVQVEGGGGREKLKAEVSDYDWNLPQQRVWKEIPGSGEAGTVLDDDIVQDQSLAGELKENGSMTDNSIRKEKLKVEEKYPGLILLAKAQDVENPFISDFELNELEDGMVELKYRTYDGLGVELLLSPATDAEKQRLASSRDKVACAEYLGNNDGEDYLVARKYNIAGSRGSIDLTKELGGGLLMVPVDAEPYENLGTMHHGGTPFPFRAKLYGGQKIFASEIDAEGGTVSMMPILGKFEFVYFQHELSHYNQLVLDQQKLERAAIQYGVGSEEYKRVQRKMVSSRVSAAEALAGIVWAGDEERLRVHEEVGSEESAANTSAEFYGKLVLDEIDGESDENKKVARTAALISRRQYERVFKAAYPLPQEAEKASAEYRERLEEAQSIFQRNLLRIRVNL